MERSVEEPPGGARYGCPCPRDYARARRPFAGVRPLPSRCEGAELRSPRPRPSRLLRGPNQRHHGGLAAALGDDGRAHPAAHRSEPRTCPPDAAPLSAFGTRSNRTQRASLAPSLGLPGGHAPKVSVSATCSLSHSAPDPPASLKRRTSRWDGRGGTPRTSLGRASTAPRGEVDARSDLSERVVSPLDRPAPQPTPLPYGPPRSALPRQAISAAATPPPKYRSRTTSPTLNELNELNEHASHPAESRSISPPQISPANPNLTAPTIRAQKIYVLRGPASIGE